MISSVKGVIAQSAVSRGGEGDEKYIRLLRDASLVVANWKQAAILQGLGYVVNVGAFSTPIQGGGAGTILDADQPELVISVPVGTSILPFYVEVCCVTPVISADAEEAEILIAVDQDTGTTTGATGTSETIYNLNTLKGSGSACTALSAVTANFTTAPVLDIELMHKQLTADSQTAVGVLWAKLYGLYEPEAAPVINGAANLIVYYGGTVAVNGFIVCKWLEFPTSALTI